jgi:Sulfatase
MGHNERGGGAMSGRDFLKALAVSLAALAFAGSAGLEAALPRVKFATKPAHAVLVVVDGLSYKAWEKMDLPVLEEMIPSGTLLRQVFLPPAAHPHEGPYAKLHTCSIPNPILMAGTIFIDERTVYFNEQFFPELTAAFAVNAIDYRSLLRNYHYVYQKAGQDEDAMRAGREFMEMGRPAFLSVHLQDTGEGGVASLRGAADSPWKNNIWHPESPYRQNLTKADRLIGDFVEGLAKLGLLETTVFIIVGDHGQADTGWHPLELWDPAITTAVLWGAGVTPKAVVDYAELIDIGPTICALMGVSAPPTALGLPIAEAIAAEKARVVPRPRWQEAMNAQFRDFRALKADLDEYLVRSDSPAKGWLYSRLNNIVRDFYGIERFIEWPRFKTVAELVEQNSKALKDLQAFQAALPPARPR